MELSPYFLLQKELDADIAKRHAVSYASTGSRRLLSLLVELGELANETRCFKYWSNKGPSTRERILDEYADGFHFLLSLGVARGIESYEANFGAIEVFSDLTEGFLSCYSLFLKLGEDEGKEAYHHAMEGYLRLLKSLGYSLEEGLEAYKKKLSVNYDRQKTGY